MHPLEDIIWKSDVAIFVQDQVVKAYRIEAVFRSDIGRPTQEKSMDDVAFKAYLNLRTHRYKDMRGDQYCYLLFDDPEQDWVMVKPARADRSTMVLFCFALQMMRKNKEHEQEINKLSKVRKRHEKELDEYRERLKIRKIYERLP